jgi:sensor domain CHASE-containing protein
MTFIVNQDGVVYEKDLGPNTATAAAAIKSFNPDASWQRATLPKR